MYRKLRVLYRLLLFLPKVKKDIWNYHYKRRFFKVESHEFIEEI